jgi:hypothetical protein
MRIAQLKNISRENQSMDPKAPITNLAAAAEPPKSPYRTSYFYLLIAAVFLGAMGMLLLPQLFTFLGISGDDQANITRVVVDKWLGLVTILATIFGANRGLVTLIKNAAPYILRFLAERAMAEESKAPDAIPAAPNPMNSPLLPGTVINSYFPPESLSNPPEPEPLPSFEDVAQDAVLESLSEKTRAEVDALIEEKIESAFRKIAKDLK